MEFDIHNQSSAHENARGPLEDVQKRYGFIPNLLGVMANSPALLKAYQSVQALFEETNFTPAERQIVLLTASKVNECHYCLAVHTTMARGAKVDEAIIQAILSGGVIDAARIDALRTFTQVVVSSRGWPSEEDIEAFLSAGFDHTAIFDVILGVGLKTMSNYTNHIAQTPVDSVFEGGIPA